MVALALVVLALVVLRLLAGPSGTFWIAEISNSSEMRSETSTPPLSRGMFHSRPKSRRLIRREPSKPARSARTSVWTPMSSSGIVTGLVTSRIVR